MKKRLNDRKSTMGASGYVDKVVMINGNINFVTQHIEIRYVIDDFRIKPPYQNALFVLSVR